MGKTTAFCHRIIETCRDIQKDKLLLLRSWVNGIVLYLVPVEQMTKFTFEKLKKNPLSCILINQTRRLTV